MMDILHVPKAFTGLVAATCGSKRVLPMRDLANDRAPMTHTALRGQQIAWTRQYEVHIPTARKEACVVRRALCAPSG